MTVSFVSSLVISTVISATLFSPNTAHAIPKPPRSKTRSAATIRVETARLRQGPGESHKSKALLDKGRDARIVGRRDGWVKLRLQSGTEGWVRSDLVKVSKKAVPDSDASESRSSRRSRSKSSRSSTKTASAKKKSSKSTAASRSASSRWSRANAVKTASAKPKAAPKAPVKVAAKPSTSARIPFLRATSLRTSPKIAAEVAAAKKAIATPDKNDTPETVKPLPETTAAETVAPVVAAVVTPVETPVVAIEASDVTPEAGSTVTPSMIAANSRTERLLRSAYSYRGTPYRMGANGRGAFDCSSFIKQIMKEQGMAMPRTAAEQYRKGTPVEKSQMQKGDLVFFKNTYKRGVSHVGMYIGDGKFIHASSRGGVRVDNLSDSYYVNHWAGARRPNW
jgi:cell wall-associated NlpC family hydrolase